MPNQRIFLEHVALNGSDRGEAKATVKASKKRDRWTKRAVMLVSTLVLFASCTEKVEKLMPETRSYAIRLKPGEDLKKSIQNFVDTNQIEAGWIASCAGSLTDYHIRFANIPKGSRASGHFEIINLSGTLSTNGSHLHISVSDGMGRMIGGHLLDECIVYTTAEIVIQSATNLRFTRQNDGTTKWDELHVEEK